MANDLESAQEAQDSSKPKEQVGAGGGQQTSSDDLNLQTIMERLGHVEKLAQALQGDKDRGVKKALSDVDELRKSFGEVQALMKKGLTEDEAFGQLEGRKAEDEFKRTVLEVRDLLKGGKSLPAQAGEADKGGYIAEAVKEAQLPPDDPRVVEWMRTISPGARKEDVALEAHRLSKRLASPPPNPSAVSPVGQTAPSGKSPEAATEDYIKNMKAARGKPTQLAAIKEKARKEGVDVDNVIFY